MAALFSGSAGHRLRARRRHQHRPARPAAHRRPRLHALLGGLHLEGAFFTPTIAPTVDALTELAPALLVPGHCTGWQAQHALAAALPDSWIQSSSGTRYHLTAA